MTGLTTVALGLQAVLLAFAGVAVYRGDVAAAVNTIGAALLAAVPVGLSVVADWPLGSVLAVWLATAGVLHSVGMLGSYESTWWWDHLTHGVSAALVAALVYAGLVAVLPDPGVVPRSVAVATVAVAGTMVVGVAWELVELVAREVGDRLDVDPVLVYYGRRDTALDLVFDLVGALVVVGVDLRVFVPLAERSPGTTRAALLGGTVALVVVLVVPTLLIARGDVSGP